MTKPNKPYDTKSLIVNQGNKKKIHLKKNNKKPSSMNFTRFVICYDSIQQGIAIWQGIILLQFGILQGVLLPFGIWQGSGRQKFAGFRRAQNNPSELS